jgi:DNA-binding NarL/FixJ family response regulator
LLVSGIRAVQAGDSLLAPSVTRRMIASFLETKGHRGRCAEVDQLTSRERETLTLMARGMSNAEIAAALYVSETTVKTHVGRVFVKLGLRDRVQAVIFAYENGLVAEHG